MKNHGFLLFFIAGLLLCSGCGRNTESILLKGNCDYAPGFDSTMLSVMSSTHWKPIELPCAFPLRDAALQNKKFITVRWKIPEAAVAICQKNGFVGLQVCRSSERALYYVNSTPACSVGTLRQFIAGEDNQGICYAPLAAFVKDSPNYLYGVFGPLQIKTYHGIRLVCSLGPIKEIVGFYYRERVISSFLIGFFLMIALYCTVLGILRSKDSYNFYFGLLTFSFVFFMCANTSVKDVLFFHNPILESKVDLISGIGGTVFLLLFMTRFVFPKHMIIAVYSSAFLGALALLALISQEALMDIARSIWYVSLVVMSIYFCTILASQAFHKGAGVKIIFIALMVVIAASVHDYLSFYGRLPFFFSLPYAFSLFIVAMTFVLARQFVSTHNSMELLNEKLEQRVEERTAELSQINKQKDKIISIIAHDLNNPITAINVTSSLMEISAKNREYKSLMEYTGLIRQACLQAMNTMQDVLRQARSRETNPPALLEKADRIAFVAPSCKMLQLRAKEKGVDLVYDDQAPPVYVLINKTGFTRVVDNLLSNAIKFTPKHGRIIVTIRKTSNLAVLQIQDNGIGIPDDIKATVWDRFTTAGRSGTDHESSTGLGLSIVKEIVEQNNGKIWFESQKDKGSKFVVEIPLA